MRNLFCKYIATIVAAFSLQFFSISNTLADEAVCPANTKCDTPHDMEDDHKHVDEHENKSGSDNHAHEGEESHGGEEAHEEQRPSVGQGKAVEAADEHQGIKLSEKTIAFFKIRFARPTIQGKLIQSSPSALIETISNTSIYVRRNGWLKEVKVQVMDRKLGKFQILEGEPMKATDEVVVEKAALVKLAELEAFGASGDGHGH